MALCKGWIGRPTCMSHVHWDGALCDRCYGGQVVRAKAIDSLSNFEAAMLAELDGAESYTQQGDDPWERSFQRPGSAPRSRAMRRLVELGLAEVSERGEHPQFRSALPIPPITLHELNERDRPW